MITVNVRSLSGRRAGVSCPPDRTLRQLKEELCCRDVAFASCKLYLRGRALPEGATIGSLSLAPGEFLVAIEVKKSQNAGGSAGASISRPSSAASTVPTQQQQQQKPSQSHQQNAPAAHPLQPPAAIAAASGGGFLPERAEQVLPGSPTRLQADAASRPALPSSPGQLDTLLPGYLSRPNPSPIKPRRLLSPPGTLLHSNEVQQGQQQQQQLQAGGGGSLQQQQPPGQQPPGQLRSKAMTLRQLAAARYGQAELSGNPSTAGNNPLAAGAGLVQLPGDPTIAGANAVGPLQRPDQADGLVPVMQQRAASLPGATVTAVTAAAAPGAVVETEEVVLTAPAPAPAPAVPASQQPLGRQASGPGSLWEDLHQELLSVQQVQQAGEEGGEQMLPAGPALGASHADGPSEAAAAKGSRGRKRQRVPEADGPSYPDSSGGGAGGSDADAGAGADPCELAEPAQRSAARKRSRAAGHMTSARSSRHRRGAASAQQQREGSTAAAAAAADGEGGGERGGGASNGSGLAGRARGRSSSRQEGEEERQACWHEDTEEADLPPELLAALPLPEVAALLESGFGIVSAVHAFLAAQHIQASWRNVAASMKGAGLREGVPTLQDLQLMAAVCPWVVSVREHRTLAGEPYREAWKARPGEEVMAAVAAAAAAESEGGPIPHPMQVRTDGAGTVLEGDPDAFVLEIVDPGRGFTKANPIPEAFFRHLRTAGLSSLPSPALRQSGGLAADAPSSSRQQGAMLSEVENSAACWSVPGVDKPSATVPAAGGKGAAEQRGSRRSRENAAARQAWAFRLALLHVLRRLEREHSMAQQALQEHSAAQQAPGHAAPQTAGRVTRSRAAAVPAEPPAQRQPSKAAAAGAAGAGGGGQQQAAGTWHPSFPAALPSLTQADLLRAALELQAEAEAAAQQASSPMDALEAARAAAGAAPGVAALGGATVADAAAAGAAVAAVRSGAVCGGRGGGRGSAGSAGVGTGPVREGGGGKPAGNGPRPAAGGLPRPPTIMKNHEPCRDTTEMGTDQFLEHLQSLPWCQGQVAHCQRMAARPAQHAVPAVQLDPRVQRALQARGMGRLFSHQARAVELLMQGVHTVVATSTASGKSLCYNIPVLQALAADPGACALFMFPTKALAQDQLRALRDFVTSVFGEGEGAPCVDIYDGDTPMADRGAIRDRAQLLITNPDMLHLSVLPVHRQFGRLLANLKYVIVDEGHSYKGVFGCHTALVLRRLRRLCQRVYDSSPTFVVTTATVANPQEHACQLLGVERVEVISEDGSPHGPKCFVLWNPPLLSHFPHAPDMLTVKLQPALRLVQQQQGRGGGRGRPAQQGRVSKRALQEHVRSQVREATQERGRGSQLGAMTEGEWVAAVKLGRRRAAVEAAVMQSVHSQGVMAGGNREGLSSHSQQQQQQQLAEVHKEGGTEQQQGVQQVRVGAGGQPEAGTSQVGSFAPAGTRAAQQALQAVQPGEPQGPPRPLIVRRAWGPQAASSRALQQQRSGGSGGSGRRRAAAAAAAGGGASLQPSWMSAGAVGEQAEVQSRLPSSANWKARSGAAGTPQDLRRSSPIVELSLLLAECVQHGVRCIAFCHTRKLCELVAAYVREILRASAPALEGTISVYRAGYSPAERREIEGALFRGQLRAVAATNALELGIDVGALDATLHLGFPGSVASLWQQAGRAGRREQSSMSIYVAWDGPLDQYFMHHPHRLFSRPVEKAQLDPRNPTVLEGHLACAAFEAPLLLPDDITYFGPGLPELASGLAGKGILGRHPEAPPSAPALHYVGAGPSPAAGVSLRAIDPNRFAIVNEAAGGEVVEEIEESKAFYEVYDGAVYMFQGRTYLCKKLDLGARVAVVRPADLKYYTKCIDYTDVHVTGGKVAFPPKTLAQGDSSASCGEALVTVRWLGFNRVWRGSGQVFDTVDLFLPDVQFQTEASYIRLPPGARQALRVAGLPFREGVHAAAHALLNVLPLHLMCNPHDVGTECDNPYDTRYRPERILIYDKHPGGIGLAAAACPIFLQLLRKALELVELCDCSSDTGCPGCIQHTCCGEYNTVLHKQAAIMVLRAILEAEELAQQGQHGAGADDGTEAEAPSAERGEQAEQQQQQQQQQFG